jgi:TPR repeat protein
MSAEGGCSWGQAEYGLHFGHGGRFVEQDKKVYVEWLEKAAKQNNPRAMHNLAEWWFIAEDKKEKAFSNYRGAAELGWKNSISYLSEMLIDGRGCEKDLRQAVIWSAKANSDVLTEVLTDAGWALEEGKTKQLDCDFNQLCYALGWGLYWYWRGSERKRESFGNRCLDYYCSCVELQQKSIFTFLLCWNRTAGVKEVGVMIGKMVWEEKEDNLVKTFEDE